MFKLRLFGSLNQGSLERLWKIYILPGVDSNLTTDEIYSLTTNPESGQDQSGLLPSYK